MYWQIREYKIHYMKGVFTMKTFKKLLAAALTAVMAVSAMGATALAAEEPEIGSYTKTDDYIISVLDENLNTVYYTREDVEALNCELPGALGTIIVNLDPESHKSEIMPIYEGGFTRTSAPTSSYSMANESEYYGLFVFPSGTRYSNHRLTNLSGRWKFGIELLESLGSGQSVSAELWANANLSGTSDLYRLAQINVYTNATISYDYVTPSSSVNYVYMSVTKSSGAPNGICYFEK